MATRNQALMLIGPTCVGKGYGARLTIDALRSKPGVEVETGLLEVGDLVRKRFGKDPEFKEKFAPIVSKGGLIADEEINPMVEAQLKLLFEHTFVILDGFPRNVPQIKRAESMGLLVSGSACIILHASRTTCFARLKDRLARTGGRMDEGAFDDRYNLHQTSLHHMQAALTKTATRVIHIDANRDIVMEVFPDILTVAESVLHKQFVHTMDSVAILVAAAKARETRSAIGIRPRLSMPTITI